MKVINLICLALLLLGFSNRVLSQEKEAKITLNRTEIKIGEQIQAELKVAFPVTENYSFALINDTLSKQIEVVEIGKIDTTYEGQNLSMKVMQATLLLTSFDTGFYLIPPILFVGINDSLATEPQLIHILDVPVDMPASDGQSEPEIAIKDIKDINEKDFSIWEWIKINRYFFLGAVLMIIAIWAYFKYLHPKLRNKQVSITPLKKHVPPFKIALNKLSEVDDQKLWQSGNVKEYHSSLSEIIREYIENQFNIPALESTTGEIKTALEHQKFNEAIISDLTAMLELSDLVKFAKMHPLGDENQHSMIQAKAFVEKTKPAETTEINDNDTASTLNV